MKNKMVKNCIAMSLVAVMLLSGCSGGEKNAAAFPEELYAQDSAVTFEEALVEPMVPLAGDPLADSILTPEASGSVVYVGNQSKDVAIDASNTADGYVMVKYTGDASASLKMILTGPTGVKYTYNLNSGGKYETFVLSSGSGKYTVGVYKKISGDKYSALFSQEIEVSLKDEFAPFLRSNQYVNYSASSEAVKIAKQLTANESNDLKKVQLIYDYVVKNITYDKQKAATVQSGYLPNVDNVLKTKKGICFDYAAVMAAMLRSQGIPTKLVTGYTGSAYHAWISTYTDETGWVEGVIFFDGNTWKLMDPTFASSGGSSEEIMKYIGDGKNYKEKFLY